MVHTDKDSIKPRKTASANPSESAMTQMKLQGRFDELELLELFWVEPSHKAIS
jgi:hypothetical protein